METVKAAVNTIAVEPMKLSDLSQGIFQTVTEKSPNIGRVLDIGPANKKVLPFKDLAVGDVILSRNYGSTNFMVGGREVALVGYDDVVGRVI